MSSNRKSWYWCKGCKQWVFSFPLGVGQMCGQCWLDLSTYDQRKQEEQKASEYLLRDYALAMS